MTWLAVTAAALCGAAALLWRSLRLARRDLGPLAAVDGRFAGPVSATSAAAAALADARARSEAVRAALAERTGTAEDPH